MAKTRLFCLLGEGWGNGALSRGSSLPWSMSPHREFQSAQPTGRDFPWQRKGMAESCFLSVKLGRVGLEMDQVHFSLSLSLSKCLSNHNAEPCYTPCLCCCGASADCGTSPVCKELQSRKLDGAQVTLPCPSVPIPHPAHEGSASTTSGVIQP